MLGVDGKAIFVRGEEHCLLIGVDQVTQDVVHALVLDHESEEGFARLGREAVMVAGYPLKGLVSDAAPPFIAAHANYFAALPLQLCRIHASRRLDFDIAKAKRSPEAAVRAELKTACGPCCSLPPTPQPEPGSARSLPTAAATTV